MSPAWWHLLYIVSDMLVLEVNNISKKYNIAKQNEINFTLREKLRASIIKLICFSGNNGDNKEFWALRNVNFEVNKGDVVGIIGMNGAGKSTLLKLLSRISPPTSGQIKIRGVVASLLEIGAGFHPELTGKENVFLNAAILGVSKKEIQDNFGNIVEFSGVEEFIDTPVKYYSSGMYVRLAFAIAAHIKSDILLIDEVLAVGDFEFQKKCLKKISDIKNTENRTIIFVSHNMEAIKKICNKVIFLEKGRVKNHGETNEVIEKYLGDNVFVKKDISYDFEKAPGNNFFRIKSLKSVFKNGSKYTTIADPINIECEFWNLMENKNINLSMQLFNQGQCILNSVSPVINLKEGCYKFSCLIPGNLLNDGRYYAKMVFSQNFSLVYDFQETCSFVLDDSRDINWFGPWIGAVRPKLNWKINNNDICP